MQTATAKRTPSIWHDILRDWQRWSHWERRAAITLGLGTLAIAATVVLTSTGFAE
jgi:hypothetical protein